MSDKVESVPKDCDTKNSAPEVIPSPPTILKCIQVYL